MKHEFIHIYECVHMCIMYMQRCNLEISNVKSWSMNMSLRMITNDFLLINIYIITYN